MDVLILVAARRSGDTSTAMLQVDGEPLVRRLTRQCQEFGPARTVVLAVPGTGPELRAALPQAEVVEVDSLPRGLTTVRDLAADAGSIGIVLADLVAHGAALAGVLARPGADAVLTGSPGEADAPALRSVRGRVVAAGSALHEVEGANRVGLGVLHLGPDGCASLAAAFDELAPALEDEAGEPGVERGSEPGVERGSEPGVERGSEPGIARLREDGLASLLPLAQVAVVRQARTRLADVGVRAFHCSRPRDAQEAAAAEASLATVDEDDLRLDAAVKSEDGFFTTFLVSPYSRHLARWAARHGLTPNQVTALSFAVGAAAAAAFTQPGRLAAVVGAVLLQAAFTLDCVDGQLARYTRQFSILGAWLDAVFDRGKEYLVYAGLAVGASRAGEAGDTVWVLAACAIALQTLRHHVDFAYAAQQGHDTVAPARVPLLQAREAGRSHWEAEPATAGPRGGPARLVGRVLRSARRMEGRGGLRWVKRVVVLPIGERFALISLVAAVGTPRLTFLALLAWGSLALAYTTTGRVLRSAW